VKILTSLITSSKRKERKLPVQVNPALQQNISQMTKVIEKHS